MQDLKTRYFEYLVSYEEDQELNLEACDKLIAINSDQILNTEWVHNLKRKKNGKISDQKAIDAWVEHEWAIEIDEKEYRKHFK